jgi:hypothetical protein
MQKVDRLGSQGQNSLTKDPGLAVGRSIHSEFAVHDKGESSYDLYCGKGLRKKSTRALR